MSATSARSAACGLALAALLGAALPAAAAAKGTPGPSSTSTTTPSASAVTTTTVVTTTTTVTSTAAPAGRTAPAQTTPGAPAGGAGQPGVAQSGAGIAKKDCPPAEKNQNLCEDVPASSLLAAGKAKHVTPPATKRAPASAPVAPVVSTPPITTPFPQFQGPPAALSSLETSALNFLLGAFPVPPFLLPIFHAAGVDYGVPWQVLAAINEIETDYGRNLSTSSAGAVGWMQFLPSTWARYGMDADGNGIADPYDPVDAIFSAARYLRAAGAGGNLRGAIFAYNHATWYVNSVELRARLLEFLPQTVVDVLTGLMQASFPIGGRLGRYANQHPKPIQVAGQPGVVLSAPVNAPVIAATDGHVVAIGRNAKLGRYVTIEDSYGDRFTYSGLGRVETVYPVITARVESAIRTARALNSSVRLRHGAAIPPATSLTGEEANATAVASGRGADRAGAVGATPARATGGSSSTDGATSTEAIPIPLVKERLFADPSRPASYAAGGSLQLESSVMAGAGADSRAVSTPPIDYEPLQFGARGFALVPLKRGSVVAAGTILGRVSRVSRDTGDVTFQVRPAGARAPIDPRPIVTGWQVLARLTGGRRALAGPGETGAYGSADPWIGQLLLSSRADLQRTVLSDRRLSLDRCTRRAIAEGTVDRRVLATIEYLSYSGFSPAVSGIACRRRAAADAVPVTQVDVTQLDHTPVTGHQQNGGIVDLAIRQLLGLQGDLRPSRIVSLRRYPYETEAIAQSDHGAKIEIDFSPPLPAGARSPASALNTAQWKRLIGRLVQLSTGPGSETATGTSTTAPSGAGSSPSGASSLAAGF